MSADLPKEIEDLLETMGLGQDDTDILLDMLDGMESTDVERAWVKEAKEQRAEETSHRERRSPSTQPVVVKTYGVEELQHGPEKGAS